MENSCLDEMKEVLGDVLHLGKRTATLNAPTRRCSGHLPELDSMAVLVSFAIEERFGITFDDDEATAASTSPPWVV